MKKTHSTIKQKLDLFEDACREAGLKVTHQRLEIFRELALAKRAETAEAQ